MRPARWFMIPVRVALVTFICTLMAFAISLLLAIAGTLIIASVHHVRADMTIAYRLVALPAALVAGSIVFILSAAIEVRHYRQAKTLAAIERVS